MPDPLVQPRALARGIPRFTGHFVTCLELAALHLELADVSVVLRHVRLDRVGDVVVDARELVDLGVHGLDPSMREGISTGYFGGPLAAFLRAQEVLARLLQLSLQHLVGIAGQLRRRRAADEQERSAFEIGGADDQVRAEGMAAHLSEAHPPGRRFSI